MTGGKTGAELAASDATDAMSAQNLAKAAKKRREEKLQKTRAGQARLEEEKRVAEAEAAAKQMFAVAEYDYEAQEDGELSFKEGDRIKVTDKSDKDWWRGTLNGREGEFPANYTKLVVIKPKAKPVLRGVPNDFDRYKKDVWLWDVDLAPADRVDGRAHLFDSGPMGLGARLAGYLDAALSPIARAGVPGDVNLVAINGMDVSSLRFAQAMMLVWRHGRSKRTMTFSKRQTESAARLTSAAGFLSTRGKSRRTLDEARAAYRECAARFTAPDGGRSTEPGYVEPPIDRVEVTLKPGAVGARLGRGPNGVGTCVLELLRPTRGAKRGTPLQLEASGKVSPGMYVTAIDGQDIREKTFPEVMLMLKARAKREKTLQFSSRLETAVVERAIARNIMGKSKLAMAIAKAKQQQAQADGNKAFAAAQRMEHERVAQRTKARSVKRAPRQERLQPLQTWEVTMHPGEWPRANFITTTTGLGAEIEAYTAPGGPLQRTGVRVGAKLRMINGRDVSMLRLGQVMLLHFYHKTKTRTLHFCTRNTETAVMESRTPAHKLLMKAFRPLPTRVAREHYDRQARAYLQAAGLGTDESSGGASETKGGEGTSPQDAAR
jgi:hypothetical protein